MFAGLKHACRACAHWTFVSLQVVGYMRVPYLPPEYWAHENKRRELESAFDAHAE